MGTAVRETEIHRLTQDWKVHSHWLSKLTSDQGTWKLPSNRCTKLSFLWLVLVPVFTQMELQWISIHKNSWIHISDRGKSHHWGAHWACNTPLQEALYHSADVHRLMHVQVVSHCRLTCFYGGWYTHSRSELRVRLWSLQLLCYFIFSF